VTPKTNTERQAEYRERMRKDGFVQLLLWVPRGAVEKLKRYVARLGKETKR
jgi:hypothetical protein